MPFKYFAALFLAGALSAFAADTNQPGTESVSQKPSDILVPGEDWWPVPGDYQAADGLTPDASGEVFFSDRKGKRIYKIGLDAGLAVFAEEPGGGLNFGADGKLYACQGSTKRVVAFDANGKSEAVADNLEPNDIAAAHNGNLYVTDSPNKKVWFINAKHDKTIADLGINFPNGIRLSPGQNLLYVADYHGDSVYSFQVLADGSLTNKQRYAQLRLKPGETRSSADGMTVDTLGRLYVTTEIGIQVCDPSGRVTEIIPRPQDKSMNSVSFGGKDFTTLFVSCGNKIYTRKTKATGVLSFQPPVTAKSGL